jgi:hypothetical protein
MIMIMEGKRARLLKWRIRKHSQRERVTRSGEDILHFFFDALIN